MTNRTRLWVALLTLGCSAVACRFGYEELPIPGTGVAGVGGSAGGATGNGGSSGDFGAGGEAPTSGGAGGTDPLGGTGGQAGTNAAGGNGGSGAQGGSAGGSGAGGVGASSGSGATGGSGGEAGAPAAGGSSGDGGGGMGGTSAAGAAGAAAAAGAGGSTTLPDDALCTQASYGGHDYLLCEEMRTWFDANGGCVAAGMRLVRVDDANENQWLFDNAVVAGGRESQVWLGGWDEPVEAEWRWTDGELFWLGDQMGAAQSGLFSGWDPREPNDTFVSDDEDCVSLELNSSTPAWYDSACSLTKGYVCESVP